MPTRVHEFSWPDRVVVAVLGQPGARTFYLQVRAAARLITVVLEKQQSALIAAKIDEILDQLRTIEGNPFSIPAHPAPELTDREPLEEVVEQFRAGAMSLAWDPNTAQIVLEAQSLTEFADDEDLDSSPPETEMLRVSMPVGTARAFAHSTRQVVDSGRPICPICGEPMDPAGHSCTHNEN